ncbi:MAG: S1 RNA-binding domain-containing protein [Ruminococcaceae bacterium]|nr:S1 RNA-binding domain-containing protein [Oscillospiraceae bacterium]
MSLEVGSIIKGKVTSVMPFGAFVSLEGNKSGMIHISEITNEYINDINDYIKNGDIVKVRIIGIDKAGKISLSIKKALEKKKEPELPVSEKVRPADIDWWTKNDENLSFEDKLSRFKKDSDERMLALKRSKESKRSGGYHRGGNSY